VCRRGGRARDGPCPTDPPGPNGSPVSDRFYFLHRDLGRDGSISVRLTSMTGTITYPPPNHDKIVAGLVPWSKVGLIIKDGVRQGSSYAAIMLTGSHGVRMQYNYSRDVAGGPGGVTERSPRWLRLTRSGDTITGYESADGQQWSTVDTVKLPGLPDTVQVGLFATSPGDLTLPRVGLGGAIEQVRFTQATGVFDSVTLDGAATGGWHGEAVGSMNHTDWEKYHNPSGAVETGGKITISGTGDIGPVPPNGARPVERTLTGLVIALAIVLVVAVRLVTRDRPATRRALRAKALIAAATAFATGLVAVAITIPIAVAILKQNRIPVVSISMLIGVRVTAGLAAVLALSAVLGVALGSLLRRGWLAIVVAVSAIPLPYLVAALPVLPDAVSQWLLRLTPAAGFAIQQTLVEYPQVTAHYAPSAGYFPLPWWAGFAVLGAYALTLMTLALARVPTDHRVDWR
jgi:hypothetical protein